MSKLKELFDEREIAYAKYSDEILQVLSKNVIPAVMEMLQLSNQEEEKLNWHNIRIVEDHVLLIGAIAYSEGDIITDDETTVALTGELAMLMSKLIRVAVPYDLADTASKEDIVEHLKESERQLKEEYKSIYGENPEIFEAAMENALTGELGWDTGSNYFRNILETANDFKIEDLTEEQQKALMMTHLANNKGNKPN